MSDVNYTGQNRLVLSISDLSESELLVINLYRSSEPFRIACAYFLSTGDNAQVLSFFEQFIKAGAHHE